MNFKYQKLFQTDFLYPKALKELKNPPKHLYISGNLEPRDLNGVAVVGTRRITSYGDAVIESIVGDLVNAGVTIISGLAFGVDAAAQNLALELGGRTIAVLGSGINNIVPKSNFYIAKKIIENNQGALISTYEPNYEATKWTFPERDTLMSALSKAVLVIEAAERSGTLHTVNAALELGKEVFVVPGSIFSEMSIGCHRYIREGAHLVTSAQDIFGALNISTSLKPAKANHNLGNKNIKPTFLSEVEESIFDSIDVYGVTIEDLCKKTQEPISKILPALTMLELNGLVKVEGGEKIRAL